MILSAVFVDCTQSAGGTARLHSVIMEGSICVCKVYSYTEYITSVYALFVTACLKPVIIIGIRVAWVYI